MLMRTDPFRELDRLTQQMLRADGTATRPAVMPMDAWRDGDTFQVEFDLPGVAVDSIALDVERNVVTVRAERPRSTAVPSCWPRNVRGEYSAGDSCWATISTPRESTRATTRVCSPCGSRSPRKPSRARSRSAIQVAIDRPSTPDRCGGRHAQYLGNHHRQRPAPRRRAVPRSDHRG